MDAPRILTAGESLLLVAFEPRIDAAVSARVLGLERRLAARRVPGVRDLVPAYATLGVHVDPLATDVERLVALIEDLAAAPDTDAPGRRHEIPVCYGGDDGPDLAALARDAGRTEAEVSAMHAGERYRVYMLGFLPGFAYLGTVPPAIARPRHAAPRRRVPAGSVGIAGAQTGIYPCDSPGGWQIIGRTPVRLFDASRTPPARFEPGDEVRFVSIGRDEFHARRGEPWP